MVLITAQTAAVTNKEFIVTHAPATIATGGLGSGETVTIRRVVAGTPREMANNTITDSDDCLTINGPGKYTVSKTTTVASVAVELTSQGEAGRLTA